MHSEITASIFLPRNREDTKFREEERMNASVALTKSDRHRALQRFRESIGHFFFSLFLYFFKYNLNDRSCTLFINNGVVHFLLSLFCRV